MGGYSKVPGCSGVHALWRVLLCGFPKRRERPRAGRPSPASGSPMCLPLPPFSRVPHRRRGRGSRLRHTSVFRGVLARGRYHKRLPHCHQLRGNRLAAAAGRACWAVERTLGIQTRARLCQVHVQSIPRFAHGVHREHIYRMHIYRMRMRLALADRGVNSRAHCITPG